MEEEEAPTDHIEAVAFLTTGEIILATDHLLTLLEVDEVLVDISWEEVLDHHSLPLFVKFVGRTIMLPRGASIISTLTIKC